MKLSTPASTIILAAALLSGQNGLVQAKNAKEFQERRRTLSRKTKNKVGTNNLPHEHDASLSTPKNTAPLDMIEDLMPMQKESRKDYIYMTEEEETMGMGTFEEFGGEVPMYEMEEEEDMGFDQQGLYYTGEEFENDMMAEAMVMEREDMGNYYGDMGEEEASLDEGLAYYTQEDIDRMFVNEAVGEMEGYYEEIEEPFINEMDMDMGKTTMNGEEEAQFGRGSYNYLTQEDIDRMVEMGAMDGYFE